MLKLKCKQGHNEAKSRKDQSIVSPIQQQRAIRRQQTTPLHSSPLQTTCHRDDEGASTAADPAPAPLLVSVVAAAAALHTLPDAAAESCRKR